MSRSEECTGGGIRTQHHYTHSPFSSRTLVSPSPSLDKPTPSGGENSCLEIPILHWQVEQSHAVSLQSRLRQEVEWPCFVWKVRPNSEKSQLRKWRKQNRNKTKLCEAVHYWRGHWISVLLVCLGKDVWISPQNCSLKNEFLRIYLLTPRLYCLRVGVDNNLTHFPSQRHAIC